MISKTKILKLLKARKLCDASCGHRVIPFAHVHKRTKDNCPSCGQKFSSYIVAWSFYFGEPYGCVDHLLECKTCDISLHYSDIISEGFI